MNVLAEFEYIAPEGLNADQSYTLVTQREPDQQVGHAKAVVSLPNYNYVVKVYDKHKLHNHFRAQAIFR